MRDNNENDPLLVTPEKLRLVIGASSLGTTFEWYDFFIFGLLTQVFADHFFAGINPAASFIFGLLTFSVGFAFRPLGALVFGSIGDKVGRKGAFLVTITLMGLSTFLVGVLPDYSQIGIWAPILLMALRIVQGFALGGEYGGAVIYVAEHSPDNKRGYYTSLVQAAAVAGFLSALVVVFLCRQYVDQFFGKGSFNQWGWRLPFLISAILLVIAVYIRMQLEESPSFKRLKADDAHSKAPLKEVFSNPNFLMLTLLALVGLMIAQGVTWYTSHFYTQVFLEKQLGVNPQSISMWLMIAALGSAGLYVFFGWLSDKVGRKPIMLFGMLLASLSFYPGFKALVTFANPDLAIAQKNAPVSVLANPKTCSVQFNPIGKTPDGRDAFSTSCDVAKSFLANNGISYSNVAIAENSAIIKIGDVQLTAPDISQLDIKAQKQVKTEFAGSVKAALKAHGYKDKADPAKINQVGIVAILLVFITAATALYGPLAASLVELFPMRIRYTALSVPYHIGTGIFGGFVPFIGFAVVATTGNMFSGLYYPILATFISIIICILFYPETKDRDIHV